MAAADVKASQKPDEDLKAEVAARLSDARAQKSLIQSDLQEAYFFTAPRRIRSVSSQTNSKTPTGDANELQTSIGFVLADDFMTILIESFMPQSAPWAERRAPPFVPDGVKQQVTDAIKAADAKIFDYIRSTNFHAELAKGGVPDAAIGVIAMDVQLERADLPPRCLAVPIRELDINLGPDGRVDDRFVTRNTKFRKLPALLPGVQLPADIAKKVRQRETKNKPCTVVWGYWRLWERTDDEYWQHVVTIDGTPVKDEVLKGAGSCPLVIGRFGATPDFAWPDGPTIKALPDYRQLDEMRAGFVENMDFTIRPPFTFEDDGVLSFEDGIEPGMGYPRRPGGTSRSPTEKIYEPNPLDAALFQEQDLERRVRKLHYADFPEQKGKTPPTASQWLDEMVEAQKKIGTPGYAFWREFPFEAFNRFRYLAEKVGGVQPIEYQNAQGVKVSVPLVAYNPAQRAQENQEVLTGTRLLQIAASAFPQTLQVMVDDQATIKNFKDKLGDKLVALRDPQQLKEAFANLAQVAGVGGPRPAGGLPASTETGNAG